MLRIQTNDKPLADRMRRIALVLTSGALDAALDAAAERVHRGLVQATPLGRTGATRRAWQVAKPALGQRLIFNPSKVMELIERGTAGRSGGSLVYPRSRKSLFTAGSADSGAPNGSSARGSSRLGRPIVAEFRPKARALLREQVKTLLDRSLS